MGDKQTKIISPMAGASLKDCYHAVEKAGGKVIKELKLINSLVCEFPIDIDVNIALSTRNQSVKVFDNINFKTCLSNRLNWWLYPQRPPIQSQQKIEWGLKRIGATSAWKEKEEKEYVKVAIIDTGIDTWHPDLRTNIRTGINTINGGSFRDDNGHGTHVAGVIAAADNNIGVVGVAPTADLYIVKAFDKDGSANLSDIIEGLQWCIANKVQIVNMSFSASESNEAFYKAIKATSDAGIIMVAAAGNDGRANSVNFPAKFTETIAVSATNKEDAIADFSSYGPEVNITAPGKDIKSTYLRGYKTLSGTSMAAPHVTGTIALALKENPNLKAKEIRQKLTMSAEKLIKMNASEQGAGLVRADYLIKML